MQSFSLKKSGIRSAILKTGLDARHTKKYISAEEWGSCFLRKSGSRLAVLTTGQSLQIKWNVPMHTRNYACTQPISCFSGRSTDPATVLFCAILNAYFFSAENIVHVQLAAVCHHWPTEKWNCFTRIFCVIVIVFSIVTSVGLLPFERVKFSTVGFLPFERAKFSGVLAHIFA